MKLKLIAALTILLCLTRSASAHRLDEYLQATLLSVDKDTLHASMRLIPGVAVASNIIATIDINADGTISPYEQSAYVQRVLNDLTLTIDGHRLKPTLTSATFPQLDQIKQGLGEIHIDFTATLPPGPANRTLILENHHQRSNAAYLVNALTPTDQVISILTQTRNQQQSIYQLNYTQAGTTASNANWWDSAHNLSGAVSFPSIFRLGMHHIAEGTDHLLFLITLLLPAPLIAIGSRWPLGSVFHWSLGKWLGPATIRSSLLRILKIVTAFTLGHSITLALAALGIVHIPSRPIEVLIAVSILISAIHALRPIFPGKEAAIAAFFGLIHGLAFAATFSELGLTRWQRVAGIFAFNLGIETMQLLVVAVTLPSLLLLSRTRAYPIFRITGALFAATAATGWIADRLLNLPNLIEPIIITFAHRAPGLAAALFVASLITWLLPNTVRHPAIVKSSTATP